MFYPLFILLVCVSFVIFTPVFPDSQTKDVDAESDFKVQAGDKVIEHNQKSLETLEILDLDIEQLLHVSEPTEEYLDLERRRILASKYLESLEGVKQKWIDPYDMGGISLNKKSEQLLSKTPETTSPSPTVSKKDDPLSSNIKKEELCTSTSTNACETSAAKEQQCLLDSIYITRWLKKVLLRIEKESGTEFSTISFPLDSHTLDTLKQMSSSKTFEVAMFDEVLSNMLAQAEIRRKEGYFEAAHTYHTDILKGIAYVSGVALFIYALHRSFLRRPKLTILGCVIVINIGWHWMHLYQKIKAHKHAELSSMQIPSQCKKHDLGLFEHMAEYLKSFFTTSECSKYYEALLVDPFWEVSLSVAATEAATATLFQPLFASSRAVNYFLKQLFDGLPIYLTAFLIIFIFFVTLMKFGYAIKLPLFMGRIEPCHPVAGSRVEELERPTQLPKLTNTVLNAVADTKSTSSKQILKEDSSMQTSFSEALKQTHSQSIEYTSKEDGTAKCVYRQDLQTSSFSSSVNSGAFPTEMHDKMISEEGLAVRSGFFEVLSGDESSPSNQHTFSETEVNLGIEIGSVISDDLLAPVTSFKKPKAPAYLKAVAKNDMHASLAQASDALVPNPINLDQNDALENLTLSKCMTDSFEIISRDDDDYPASMHSSRSAGPNCDTSMDNILLKMHRAQCEFCNSTDSIG